MSSFHTIKKDDSPLFMLKTAGNRVPHPDRQGRNPVRQKYRAARKSCPTLMHQGSLLLLVLLPVTYCVVHRLALVVLVEQQREVVGAQP